MGYIIEDCPCCTGDIGEPHPECNDCCYPSGNTGQTIYTIGFPVTLNMIVSSVNINAAGVVLKNRVLFSKSLPRVGITCSTISWSLSENVCGAGDSVFQVIFKCNNPLAFYQKWTFDTTINMLGNSTSHTTAQKLACNFSGILYHKSALDWNSSGSIIGPLLQGNCSDINQLIPLICNGPIRQSSTPGNQACSCLHNLYGYDFGNIVHPTYAGGDKQYLWIELG